MNIIKIKKISSYMFSFLLLLSILVSYILNMASRTILSEDYMISKLSEVNYYTKIMSTIQKDFESYIYQSGFDKTILENVITGEKVKVDVNMVIHSIYENSSYTINTSMIEQNLNANIDNYVKNKNITLDVKQKEDIKEIVNTLTVSYVKDIFPKDIINPISNTIFSINSGISRIGQFIQLLPYIFILCIILVNISKTLTSFKYISVAVLSSGMFLSLSYIILINVIQIGKITIFNQSISDILNLLFKNIFSEINFFCIVFTLTGILLTFIFVIIENKFDFEILGRIGANGRKWLYKY